MNVKKRKTRVINNSIVNIDDVTIEPGVGFDNWTIIAKQKLKQREIVLLQQRLEICNEVILSSTQRFISQIEISLNMYQTTLNIPLCRICRDTVMIYQQHIEKKISHSQLSHSQIVAQYMRCVDDEVSKWNGFKPKKKTIKTFREYFQGSRRWFDQRKIRLLATAFWIPILRLIQTFAERSASHIFCVPSSNLQKAYVSYLSLYVSKGLFEAYMKPSNARHMFLIPATAYSVFIKLYKSKLKLIGKNKDMRIRYLHAVYSKIADFKASFENELNNDQNYNANHYAARADGRQDAQRTIRPSMYTNAVCDNVTTANTGNTAHHSINMRNNDCIFAVPYNINNIMHQSAVSAPGVVIYFISVVNTNNNQHVHLNNVHV